MSGLSPAERQKLKGRAHKLEPVVIVGGDGLSASVIAEIDRSLKTHELIKVRVNADRRGRDAMLKDICAKTGAQAVQHIGKILVLFRENPELRQDLPDARHVTHDDLDRQLEKIVPRLTDRDKQTLKERIGIELDNRRLHPGLFSQYDQVQQRIRSFEARAMKKTPHGIRCSFCQGHASEAGHMVKLSESHVMCAGCIGLLVESIKEQR
jgi:putative YhbY family RNA-binding protein